MKFSTCAIVLLVALTAGCSLRPLPTKAQVTAKVEEVRILAEVTVKLKESVAGNALGGYLLAGTTGAVIGVVSMGSEMKTVSHVRACQMKITAGTSTLYFRNSLFDVNECALLHEGDIIGLVAVTIDGKTEYYWNGNLLLTTL